MTTYDPFVQREAREDSDRRKFVAQQQQQDDVRWLMSDPRGRRLMWSWLEFCGVRRTAMTGNSQTFFNLGVQNAGLMLEANIMQHAPEMWLVMVNEAREPKRETGAGAHNPQRRSYDAAP